MQPVGEVRGRAAAAGVPRADRLRDRQHVLPASESVRFGAVHAKARRWKSARALFTVYLLPFEVTSVLILIAILGAIVLARKEID